MFAITGITGRVGGIVARTLLGAGKSVRAVMRDRNKGREWEESGCEIAVAGMLDSEALAKAFAGMEGVFVLPPPIFDPAPGFPEARGTASAIRTALEMAHPSRVLSLSTIGAQAGRSNLLTQHSIMEKTLGDLPLPITFLRPAWFMENSRWDIASAREKGVISSFLQPLDKPVPMVATAEVGKVGAQLLQETWSGRRVVELEGPGRVTPNEMAAALARVLRRPVRAEAVARDAWEDLFISQGMKNPGPRMEMLDGFNEGWIEFENGEAGSRKGTMGLEAVLKALIAAERFPEVSAPTKIRHPRRVWAPI